MRDPRRIHWMTEMLADYWEQHPDLRLGQLVQNLASRATPSTTVFFVEDSALLAQLMKELEGGE